MTRTPQCPHFGTCGGCARQDIPYQQQLDDKLTSIAGLLNIDPAEVNMHAGEEYGYRNRMDFVFSMDAHVGLKEKGNWRHIIPVKHCPIANQRVNELLIEVNAFAPQVEPFDGQRQSGTFKYAVIRATEISSCITFILSEGTYKQDESEEAIKAFARQSTADTVICGYVPRRSPSSIAQRFLVVKGSKIIKARAADRDFRFHCQGFFQTNSHMADMMVRHVHNQLSKKGGELLLDLYGGVGTFGITASRHFNRVKIVEIEGPAIECAGENIKNHNIRNAEAIASKAKNIHMLEIQSDDLHVVNDPPRSGMAPKTIKRLIGLEPKTITYVSCKPEKLAEELPEFLQAGYTIETADLFDLFPQTPHCEAVLRLVKG